METNFEDLKYEHSQHNPPYWKLMHRCSECNKKHEEIVARSRTATEAIKNLSYLSERSEHPSEKYW